MFTRLTRRAAAVAALLLPAMAAQAAPLYQISSPVYWSSNGSYADLVLRYDPHATVALTVNQLYGVDIFGQNVATQLETCGTPVKAGDSVVAHSLNPGQYCWVRLYRTGNAIAGRAVLTGAGAGVVSQFVRTSLEIRDANNNVVTHVELR